MSDAPVPTLSAPMPGDPIDRPFWDGLTAGELRIPSCSGCGRWTWPPQWRCGLCGSWDMAWRPVAMTGIVHSLTCVRHPFTPAMAGRTPFANLLVELPQAGGARLMGVLEGPGDSLAIGSPLTGDVMTEADGHLVLRWRMTA